MRTSILFIVLILLLLNVYSLSDKNSDVLVGLSAKLLKTWQVKGGLGIDLSKGDSGEDVLLAQELLRDKKHLDEATGYFGDKTRSAVKAFQKEEGIPQTGNIGPATRDKMNEYWYGALCPKPAGESKDYSLHNITNDSPLPLDHVPADLVSLKGKVKTIGHGCLRETAAEFLSKMFKDAEGDGLKLIVTSAYRRPELQLYTINYWISKEGLGAFKEVALPGASEHQLGTAVDLSAKSLRYEGASQKLVETKEGKWLESNAHRYGFVMSYPENKEGITGFSYEPWHFRFVGPEIAEQVKLKNITLREYLAVLASGR